MGAATVGAAGWWFVVADDGPMISLYQLVYICFELKVMSVTKSDTITRKINAQN